MDRETAALIQNSRDLAQWCAEQVVEIDQLIEACDERSLSRREQQGNLRMQRALLTRISQRDSLAEWALASRQAPVWLRLLRRLRRRA